jgi:hypothetical protein
MALALRAGPFVSAPSAPGAAPGDRGRNPGGRFPAAAPSSPPAPRLYGENGRTPRRRAARGTCPAGPAGPVRGAAAPTGRTTAGHDPRPPGPCRTPHPASRLPHSVSPTSTGSGTPVRQNPHHRVHTSRRARHTPDPGQRTRLRHRHRSAGRTPCTPHPDEHRRSGRTPTTAPGASRPASGASHPSPRAPPAAPAGRTTPRPAHGARTGPPPPAAPGTAAFATVPRSGSSAARSGGVPSR